MCSATPHPDFEKLIADAYANRKPVSLDHAKAELGDFFAESDLAYETVMMRGDEDVALTPTTWLRLVRKAKQKHDGGRDAGTTR